MTTDNTPDVMQFEIVKHVTLPQIKLSEDGSANYLKIESAIEKGKDLQEGRTRTRRDESGNPIANTEPMAPPDLCEVINLQTGELGLLIVNAVIKSNLEEKYPEASYVGKCFMIKRLATVRKGSRKYYTFEITEIRLKEKAPEQAKAKK